LSSATSPSSQRTYGVARVCRVFGVPRSTFYAHQRPEPVGPANKRGPRTTISDAELLSLIREDLATTLFKGEGYRKVWARLRVQKAVHVGSKRVLRLMRDNHLLSPHRGRQGGPEAHDGKIITDAPNVMWGTDGTRILTADEGWVWLFTAVEHWSAECVGWHVCKKGDRYAALEPIAMALENVFGSTAASVARGLSLRMDHGTQYLSDHFDKQIRFWGIEPSFAFVEEPETNGVAERFNRTLKEQAVHGRVFRNLEEVRAAIADFVERYNEHWLVEKMGFASPRQARADYEMRLAA